MTAKLFGTDGIRGTSNAWPMDAETALKVGMAAAIQFNRGDHRHRVVIGKDTRLSGYLIEPALTAGFISMGMDVILVGPLPTPAIAMLTLSLRADLGVMISASHNPYEDNGIKLFGSDGYKLFDSTETEIEARLNSDMTADLADPAHLGHARRLDDARGRYNEYIKQTFPYGLRLDGLKVAVDCANGASYKVAPEVLWELGAEVIPIGVDPDGVNINKGCGSTDMDAMRSLTVTHGCDLGLSLDGDADRVLMADEKGDFVDGDQMLGLIAKDWADSGRLQGDGIVSTVMANLGLEQYLQSLDLEMVRTQVGDRYVAERMRKDGYNVGGEQSGHIILSDYSTTGDGLIAALQVLAVIVNSGKKASEVCKVFEPLPQVLVNVKFNGGRPLEEKSVQKAIKDGEDRLAGCGRLLIRPSGTEPLIRVMAEGEDEALVKAVVGDIAGVIEQVSQAT